MIKSNRSAFSRSRRSKLLLFSVSVCAVLAWVLLRANPPETIDLGYVPYTADITQQYSLQSPVLRTLQGWLLHKPQSRQLKILWKSSQYSTFQCHLTYNRTTQKLYYQFRPPTPPRYRWQWQSSFPFFRRTQTLWGCLHSLELTISDEKLKKLFNSRSTLTGFRSQPGRVVEMFFLINAGPTGYVSC